MSYSFSLEIFVQATPDEVMELLTNADFIKDWSGASAEMKKEIGGSFTMFNGSIAGKLLKFLQNELVFTWNNMLWEDDTQSSQVQLKLLQAEHGTNILLQQTEIVSEAIVEKYQGWWKYTFFEKLGDYLSNRNL